MKPTKPEEKKQQDSSDSNYGRKKAYCAAHGVWGWEVPEPKPWKKAHEKVK
jgi:hypothetical protein